MDVASRRVLGLRVDATSYAHAIETVCARAARGESDYVCVATVHMVMEAFDDADYRAIVNGGCLVTPDGMPLVWALRSQGVPDASRVYGPDLMPLLCAEAERRALPIGLYGGSGDVLDRITEVLAARHPALEIAYRESPPFRPPTPEEDERTVAALRESGARILFVGLGCPKQERWMAAHAGRVPAMMLGVGAAFDFLAGVKPSAPGWMQRAGLEWLFRLATEPRRLAGRYLRHNPRFLAHYGLERWRGDAADQST